MAQDAGLTLQATAQGVKDFGFNPQTVLNITACTHDSVASLTENTMRLHYTGLAD